MKVCLLTAEFLFLNASRCISGVVLLDSLKPSLSNFLHCCNLPGECISTSHFSYDIFSMFLIIYLW
jgi:hypothetical protein